MDIIEVGKSLLCKGGFTMMATAASDTFIDNAKVMAKGQITIPKDVREILGVANGSHVTFVVEKGAVRLVNSAVYAMQMLQHEMTGEAEKSGLTTETEVNNLIKEVRVEG